MIPNQAFSRPIPGQGLTHPMGKFPWQQPPQHTDPYAALDKVWDEITQPTNIAQILYFLEQGLTCYEIAKIVLFAGFTNGLWNHDLMVLMCQPVTNMVEGLGHKAGIKYKLKPPTKNPLINTVMEQKFATALQQAQNPTPVQSVPATPSIPTDPITQANPTGLMTRPQ